MSSDQAAPMESSGGPYPHGDAPPVSAKKLWRVMRAVYLVLVKKHQPKLAALGVHLHHLLSSKGDHRGRLAAAREQWHPALTYLSSLSCRSMDPAAAVVHPYPRGHGHGHRRASSSRPAAATASLSSLSCRSMDPAAAVHQYQYRTREVQFSCKSTPRRKRRRAPRPQHGAADQGCDHSSEPESYFYASAAAVTRLFELMDAKDAAETTGIDYDDDDDLDLDAAVAWPAPAAGLAPRQVRITDSPFPAREEIDEVDRRADEFIMWFHEQLRTQQQSSTRYWVRYR